jgi:subtilisin family serine protease
MRALIVIAAALAFGLVPPALGAGRHPRGESDHHAFERHDHHAFSRHEHNDAGEGEDDDGEQDGDHGQRPRPITLEQRPIAGLGAPKVRYVPGELLVRFRVGTSNVEMRAAASRAGGTIVDHIAALGIHVAQVPPSRTQKALASLRSEPSVVSVERDVLMAALDTVPNDALWSTQWGSRLVGAPRAWDSTRGANAVVIAILDTGVDSLHPDLAGATVVGRDLVNDDNDPADDEGHGTAVAGVIAARTNNREGQSGICWVCSLMAVKVMDSTGSGKTSTIAAGIVWAVDHGARVINMSFGGPAGTSALEAAVGYASKKGVVLVAAAGNSGVDTHFYPAAYGDVISVAGTTSSDTRYSWSNYGVWVQVAAPGCNTAPDLGGGYVDFCGTSAAAPVVAGIAGLALSLVPAASETAVQQAIAASATPLPGVARYGRVNAPVVLSGVSGAGSSTPVQPPAPIPPSPAPAAAPPAPTPPAAVPTAPVNVQRPRLLGRARVGLALRVVPGTWQPAPLRFDYQWQRCLVNGAQCRTIAGAHGRRYRLRRSDRGHRLRAVITALAPTGTARTVSGMSSLVRLTRGTSRG